MHSFGEQFHCTRDFLKAYNKLPAVIQRKLERQLGMLLENVRYPSLRAKKMTNQPDIWEARVDLYYRFTFDWCDGVIRLRSLGRHDITYDNP